MTEYGLRHLVAHLCATGELAQAVSLVTDPSFLAEKQRLLGGTAELVRDLDAAEQACREADRSDLVGRIAQSRNDLLRSLPQPQLATDIHLTGRVAVAAGGQFFAAVVSDPGTGDRSAVRVWSLDPLAEKGEYRGLSGPVGCIALSADGTRVAAVAGGRVWAGTVTTWTDLQSPIEAATITDLYFGSNDQLLCRQSDQPERWYALGAHTAEPVEAPFPDWRVGDLIEVLRRLRHAVYDAPDGQSGARVLGLLRQVARCEVLDHESEVVEGVDRALAAELFAEASGVLTAEVRPALRAAALFARDGLWERVYPLVDRARRAQPDEAQMRRAGEIELWQLNELQQSVPDPLPPDTWSDIWTEVRGLELRFGKRPEFAALVQHIATAVQTSAAKEPDLPAALAALASQIKDRAQQFASVGAPAPPAPVPPPEVPRPPQITVPVPTPAPPKAEPVVLPRPPITVPKPPSKADLDSNPRRPVKHDQEATAAVTWGADHESLLQTALVCWIQTCNRLTRNDGDEGQRRRHLKRCRDSAAGDLEGIQTLLRYAQFTDDYDPILAAAVDHWGPRLERTREILRDDRDGFTDYEIKKVRDSAIQTSQVAALCELARDVRGVPPFRTVAGLSAFLKDRHETLFQGAREKRLPRAKYLPCGLAIFARNGQSLIAPGTNTGTARDYAEAAVVCGISVLLSA